MSGRIVWDELLAGPLPQVGPLLLLFGLAYALWGLAAGRRAAATIMGLPLLLALALILRPPHFLNSYALSTALFYLAWGGSLGFGARRGFTPLAGAAAGALMVACSLDSWYYEQLAFEMPALWMADLANRVILAASWAVETLVPGSARALSSMLAPAGLWAADNAGVLVRAGAGLLGILLLARLGPRHQRIEFDQWRLGRSEPLLLLPLLAMFLLLDSHGSEAIRRARLFYLGIPFAIQGISVVWSATRRLGRLPAGALAALALAPPVLALYAFIGLFDYLIDLRGLDRRPRAAALRRNSEG